jgi:hypothetical protein
MLSVMMNVVVVESERGAARDVETALLEAGHTVCRCHEVDLPAFPCNAILSGHCPMDGDGDGVDVAVTVRPHVRPTPAPLEDGIACALRHRVPVVLVGRGVLNPYERFGVQECPDAPAVVEACTEAVRRHERELAADVARIAREVCAWFRHDATGMRVDVELRGNALVATITTPNGPRRMDTAVSSAVTRVVRAKHPELRLVQARIVGTGRERT